MPTSQRPRRSLHLAGIAVAVVAAYSNSFGGTFQFDDNVIIVTNRALERAALFLDPVAMYRLAGASGISRFFGILTFGLDRQVWGLDARGFHLTNLCVHLAASALVYALVILLFRTPRLARSAVASRAPWIALAAGVLFALHPVQTQAVTYIVQRLASLATLLGLAGLCAWLRFRLGARRRRLAWLAVSLVGTSLAMVTKEIAFTFPLLAVLAEALFFEGEPRRRLAGLVGPVATMAIVPLIVLAGAPMAERLAAGGEQGLAIVRLGRWEYLLTELRVGVTYLRLLALPVRQNLFYDYPILRSLAEPAVLLSLALHVALVAGAGLLVVRARRRSDPVLALVAFGLAWFYLALSVESGLVVIVDVIYEHRLYYPSIGIAIAIAAAGGYGAALAEARWPWVPRTAAVLLATVALALGVATFVRNRVWADEVTLWADVAEKSPDLVSGHQQLSRALAARGRFAEAELALRRALEVSPYHVDAYGDLAWIYARVGRPARQLHALATARYVGYDLAGAASLWEKALALDPGDRDAHYGRALVLGARGRLDEASDELRLACAMGSTQACGTLETGRRAVPAP